ncbi:uncharacterized protein LOC103701592 [Phoenix dactylifera]|uniref:Uncharacterized protein LOC103701592 n=1 Tax=Phoenix dactylifera TaxID=42345 RepID=A0A8B7BN37_PHODC|nr:uncharacterized protein LOC103701592 [Phoenix dactylifera]
MNSPHFSDARNSPTGRCSAPPRTDLFEFFFHGPRSPVEMCTADDVFLQGKLLPFGAAPPRPPKKDEIYKPRSLPRDQWQQEAATGYRRLRKAPESDLRVPPPPQTPRTRSRWYLFVLGSVRVPAAMEIKDIRSRQRRRCPAGVPEDSGRWSRQGSKSWKLLRSLSCNGVESAVAAAPPSFVSHV